MLDKETSEGIVTETVIRLHQLTRGGWRGGLGGGDVWHFRLVKGWRNNNNNDKWKNWEQTKQNNNKIFTLQHYAYNCWPCLDWAPCIQRGFQIIRWHSLSSTAEVSLCRTGVWGKERKKVLTARLLFFRYSCFHWITQKEPAGWGGRGERLTQKKYILSNVTTLASHRTRNFKWYFRAKTSFKNFRSIFGRITCSSPSILLL